jgi:hypothetical protein
VLVWHPVNPIIHAELSWLAALKVSSLCDRRLIVFSGIAPDIDGLTILAGNEAYGHWHHLVFHGFFSALLTAGICAIFAERKLLVAGMALLAFHLHLFCDLLGSGPGWPIAYFWPLSDHFYGWEGGWELVSWQNTVIGMVVTLTCLGAALFARRTFTEVFSVAADQQVVRAIRNRAIRSADVADGS